MTTTTYETNVYGEQVKVTTHGNGAVVKELVRDHVPIPATERNVTGVAYLRRFTQDERIAIRAAAAGNVVLDDYLKLMDATIAQGGLVNLLDPDTITAVNLLEQSGLLAAGRAAQILDTGV